MASNKKETITVGSPAPDFMLQDSDGNEWHLSDQRGRVVVLLFYPGDETPVCTRQLCSVRDSWESYTETGAEVVGISTDSVESHRKFAEHHGLPLRLLSDPSAQVCKLYGASSWRPGKAARAVVVIDAGGIVRYYKVEALSLFRPRERDILQAIRQAQENANLSSAQTRV